MPFHLHAHARLRTEAFKDGILHGWVAQEPKDLGVQAVRAAASLAGGGVASAFSAQPADGKAARVRMNVAK